MNVKIFATELADCARDLHGIRSVITDIENGGAGLLVICDDETRIYVNLVEVAVHPGRYGQ